jgi:hypothetical protein
MDPLLFSVADAAPILAIRETRLRELIDAGRIATVRLDPGGDTYIRRCDLEAFVTGLVSRRKGEPIRLPVTNAITNQGRPSRRVAGRSGPATVKSVRIDEPDEAPAGWRS